MNIASKDCPVDVPNYALQHVSSISVAKLDSDKSLIVPSGSRFSSRSACIPNQELTISNPPTDCASCSNYSSYSTTNNVARSHSIERFSAQSTQPITNDYSSHIPEWYTNSTSQATPSIQHVSIQKELKPPRYPRYSTELRKSDLIRCFQCGIGHKDFTVADNPLVEHINNAKSCPYLEAMFGPEGVQSRQEARCMMEQDNGRQRHCDGVSGNQVDIYPQYRSLESRLLTFESNNFRCTKLPQELAEAGLFYTGVGDEVRCFSCSGGLRNWEQSDDPWTEHCKWFPHCEYAHKVNSEPDLRITNEATTMLNTTSGPPTSPNEISIGFDLTSLQTTCTDMGFAADIVDTSVERLQQDGIHCPNIDDIINKIDQIQKDIEETSRRNISDTFVEENTCLKSMLTCDKCKTNQSNALFLPCAHHVMCIECARDLKLCPVCNREVEETIRTFMS